MQFCWLFCLFCCSFCSDTDVCWLPETFNIYWQKMCGAQTCFLPESPENLAAPLGLRRKSYYPTFTLITALLLLGTISTSFTMSSLAVVHTSQGCSDLMKLVDWSKWQIIWIIYKTKMLFFFYCIIPCVCSLIMPQMTNLQCKSVWKYR